MATTACKFVAALPALLALCSPVAPALASGSPWRITPAAQEQQQQQPASAQPAGSGTLTSVSGTGSQKYTNDQIAVLAGLKIGQAVTRQDLQSAADRLAATGLFTNVRFRFSSEGPNVSLEFQLADAPTVPVRFDNFARLTNDDLASAIRQQVGLFDGSAPKEGSYLDDIGAAITKTLATKGIGGKVEHLLVQRPDGDGMEQEFRLAEQELKVASVTFSDTIAAKDPHVQERLSDLTGKPYSRYAIRVFLTEQVRPVFLSQGFLKVDFGPPKAELVQPAQGEASQVRVEVPVTRGPRYTWGGTTWSGNSVFDAVALDRITALRTGETADGLAITAAWDHVRQEYGSKGYLDTALDPQPVYDDAKDVVRYDVKVSEGPSYKMGKLVITGLSVEAERRVRDAWEVHPGQTFDLDYYLAFLDDIAKKALADLPVHYDHIGRFLQRDSQDDTVDVLLDFH